MKPSFSFLLALIFFLLGVLIVTLLNTFFEFRPVLDLLYFFEKEHPAIIVSLIILMCTVLFLVFMYRIRNKRFQKERYEMFRITIHTVQDILQKSSARIQNVILDMEELDMDPCIVQETKESLEENIKLMKILSSLEPNEVFKNYDKNQFALILKHEKTMIG